MNDHVTKSSTSNDISAAPPRIPAPGGAWAGKVVDRSAYLIELDPVGLILCRPHGFWTIADVDSYFDVLREIEAASRRRFGRVLVLSDSSDSVVQAPEVAARFESYNDLLDPATDKVALVVGSALKKMQMKRGRSGEHYQYFASCSDGRDWLMGRA